MTDVPANQPILLKSFAAIERQRLLRAVKQVSTNEQVASSLNTLRDDVLRWTDRAKA